MAELKIRIKLESDTLTGSGEGWGAEIDNDAVFDDCGIPYIPAKRIKGCLRESALEVAEMFERSGICSDLNKIIDEVFGESGKEKPSPVIFDNLYIEDYQNVRKWLAWYIKETEGIVSVGSIKETYTITRSQTVISIEDNKEKGIRAGIALENSLRTGRMIKRDKIFEGLIEILHRTNNNKEEIENILILASANLQRIGTNRNRGMGEVGCSIVKDKISLKPTPEMIELFKEGGGINDNRN